MLYIVLSVVLFAIDQLTKLATVKVFSEGDSQIIINGILSFSRHHNTGGPWSIFDSFPQIFVIMTILILIAEIFIFKKYPLKHTISKLSCSLINAGAIGNLVDRVFRGYVVDMIDVDFINYPTFNFADCCIVVGCILMCVYVIFIDREQKMN